MAHVEHFLARLVALDTVQCCARVDGRMAHVGHFLARLVALGTVQFCAASDESIAPDFESARVTGGLYGTCFSVVGLFFTSFPCATPCSFIVAGTQKLIFCLGGLGVHTALCALFVRVGRDLSTIRDF